MAGTSAAMWWEVNDDEESSISRPWRARAARASSRTLTTNTERLRERSNNKDEGQNSANGVFRLLDLPPELILIIVEQMVFVHQQSTNCRVFVCKSIEHKLMEQSPDLSHADICTKEDMPRHGFVFPVSKQLDCLYKSFMKLVPPTVISLDAKDFELDGTQKLIKSRLDEGDVCKGRIYLTVRFRHPLLPVNDSVEQALKDWFRKFSCWLSIFQDAQDLDLVFEISDIATEHRWSRTELNLLIQLASSPILKYYMRKLQAQRTTVSKVCFISSGTQLLHAQTKWTSNGSAPIFEEVSHYHPNPNLIAQRYHWSLCNAWFRNAKKASVTVKGQPPSGLTFNRLPSGSDLGD